MRKATHNRTPQEQAKRQIAEHWRRRAAEARRQGRTAEAETFLKLAERYARDSRSRRA